MPLGILSVTCILPEGESRPAYYSKTQIQNDTNIQIQIQILIQIHASWHLVSDLHTPRWRKQANLLFYNTNTYTQLQAQ